MLEVLIVIIAYAILAWTGYGIWSLKLFFVHHNRNVTLQWFLEQLTFFVVAPLFVWMLIPLMCWAQFHRDE